MVSVEGEAMRAVTWVTIEEIASGEWGIAGNALHTGDFTSARIGPTWRRIAPRLRLSAALHTPVSRTRVRETAVTSASSSTETPPMCLREERMLWGCWFRERDGKAIEADSVAAHLGA